MDIGKVAKGLKMVYVGICGISTGYLAMKAMDKKTDELVEDKGLLNAAIIGFGQGTIAACVGIATAIFVDKFTF